jgi:excisionase family DNA binding protein
MDNGRLAELVAREVYRLLEPELRKLEERSGPAPEYVTLREAAKRTSFSYDLIYDSVRKGELPAVKKGRDWRVAVADLRGWMEKDRGGKPLPPRSERADLVRRHFPDLSS